MLSEGEINVYKTDNFNKNYKSNKDKLFDKLLTYRRRITRIAICQGIYSVDLHAQSIKKNITNINNTSDFFNTRPILVLHNIIYFFKNFFFNKESYGKTKRTKKIDERLFYDLSEYIIYNAKKIDELYENQINNHVINTLPKAIIRSAIGEFLFLIDSKKEILIAEYTNIASIFLNIQDVKFINAILDKILIKDNLSI